MSLSLWAWAGWEFLAWQRGKQARRIAYMKALQISRRRKKPLLIIGEPDGEYPCPPGPQDVVVDLRQKSACKNYVQANVESMSMFKSKQFGAVLVSHVLEHVCDPEKALRELTRVADVTIAVYPSPWRVVTWLIPGHVWVVFETKDGPKFLRIRRKCNLPGRYGTGSE
jgi:hypothetical protein